MDVLLSGMAWDDYANQIEKQACGTAAIGRPASLRESLEYELKRAEADAARLKELLALLEKNPDTSRIMELLGRR